MNIAKTFRAAADPAGLGAFLVLDAPEGEHVVSVTVDLDDPTKTTVEGPPLVLLIDEGLITRRVPLTAHGVAAQVRGPAVLSIEDDPNVALRPAAGTWRGAIDVRPGTVSRAQRSHDVNLTNYVYGPLWQLPFGAIAEAGIVNAQDNPALHFYSPAGPAAAPGDIWGHDRNSSSQSRSPYWPVPRGASHYAVYNNGGTRTTTVSLIVLE